jgi:hypothetical protein
MKNWIPKALLGALLAGACHAGVFTQAGDHPNTDVQLPSSQFLNFTLSSAILNREFPQYNYAEQGDLVGYFGFNPAELVIWAPRATKQLDQDPPVGALLQLTDPLLETPQLPDLQSPPFEGQPPSQNPPAQNPPVNPPVIPVVDLGSPPPPPIVITPVTDTTPHSSAVPEPSLGLLVGIGIAVMTAMRSAKLLRRQ